MKKQHFVISFDVESEYGKIKNVTNFQSAPKNSYLTAQDMLNILSSNSDFMQSIKHELTNGLIVTGSRSVEDVLLVEELLRQLTITKDDEVRPTLILNSTPGPAWIAGNYAKCHKLNIERIIPDWDKYRNYAGGVCALKMLQSLVTYDKRAVLLIWDEHSTEVPYFFETTLELDVPLYVWSTVRNDWLTTNDLSSAILEYNDRLEHCKEILHREQEKN